MNDSSIILACKICGRPGAPGLVVPEEWLAPSRALHSFFTRTMCVSCFDRSDPLVLAWGRKPGVWQLWDALCHQPKLAKDAISSPALRELIRSGFVERWGPVMSPVLNWRDTFIAEPTLLKRARREVFRWRRGGCGFGGDRGPKARGVWRRGKCAACGGDADLRLLWPGMGPAVHMLLPTGWYLCNEHAKEMKFLRGYYMSDSNLFWDVVDGIASGTGMSVKQRRLAKIMEESEGLFGFFLEDATDVLVDIQHWCRIQDAPESEVSS